MKDERTNEQIFSVDASGRVVKASLIKLSERNRNVLCLLEIEMSAGQSFRLAWNPRRQG